MSHVETLRARQGGGIVARLRSWTFDAALALWTAAFLPLIPVLMLLRSPPRAVRVLTRIWARGILVELAVITGLRFREIGRSNIPAEPCLVICNHESTWETLAALVIFPGVAIVAKKELLRIPVLGWFLRQSPMIIIDRDEGTASLRKMLSQASAAVEANRSVLIFPEGSRKSSDGPIEFKRGVELLYRKLDIAVLPVVVNSGQFWNLANGRKTSGTIEVTYLPTIPPGLADFCAVGEQAMQSEKTRRDQTPSARTERDPVRMGPTVSSPPALLLDKVGRDA